MSLPCASFFFARNAEASEITRPYGILLRQGTCETTRRTPHRFKARMRFAGVAPTALGLASELFPALTRWANFCHASGVDLREVGGCPFTYTPRDNRRRGRVKEPTLREGLWVNSYEIHRTSPACLRRSLSFRLCCRGLGSPGGVSGRLDRPFCPACAGQM